MSNTHRSEHTKTPVIPLVFSHDTRTPGSAEENHNPAPARPMHFSSSQTRVPRHAGTTSS